MVTDLWQRWGWLGYWALAGVFALGMVGVLCLALARGRVLQAVGMLLVLAPVALLLLAALAATVAIAVALLSPRDRARGEE